MTMHTLLEELKDAHQALSDYWTSKKSGDTLPSRRDVNPCHLRRYLSHLTILEISEGDCEVRLSGGAAKQAFGLKQKARLRSDLRHVESDWWIDTARQTAEAGGPLNGARRARNGIHVWLRLPMLDSDGTSVVILCHDFLVTSDMGPNRQPSNPEPLSIAA